MVQRETPQPQKILINFLQPIWPQTTYRISGLLLALVVAAIIKLKNFYGDHYGVERHFEKLTNAIFQSVPSKLRKPGFQGKTPKV